MNKSTSVYLDAVRFFASFIVFVGHVSGQRLTGGLLWQVGGLGPEAVDVFFVLSGFVIYYVADTREQTPVSYFVSRAARIYSVAIPALIITFLLDAIGRSISPSMYSASWHYVWDERWLQVIMALSFTNQLWWNNLPPGSDFPYWSLGFEVWYYILFGLALFFRSKTRLILLIICILCMGPKVTALLPLWLSGCAAYLIAKRKLVKPSIGVALFILSIAVWIVYEIYVWHYGRAIHDNWLGRPPLVQDYIIGSLFFINLVGFVAFSDKLTILMLEVEKPVRWLAGATLTLYLFHMPLAQFLASTLPWPSSSWETRLAVYIGVPIMVFIIANYTERKKKTWHNAIDWLVCFVKTKILRCADE